MKTSNYTVQIIEPNEGFYLTQVEEVDIMNRVFSEKIFLAVNDSPSNWKEISKAEGDAIIAEREALIEAEAKKDEE